MSQYFQTNINTPRNIRNDAQNMLNNILNNMAETGELDNLSLDELLEEQELLIDQLDLDDYCYSNDTYTDNNDMLFTNTTDTLSLFNEKLINNRKTANKVKV